MLRLARPALPPLRRALHAVRRGADTITVSDLQLDCIVGVYLPERRRPQPLRIDIEMEVDTRTAAHSESCASTLDYFAVAEQARFIAETGRFRLLETAAHAIARQLVAPPAPGEERGAAHRVRVTLTKPEAISDGKGKPFAVPSVSVCLDAAEESFAWTPTPFGAVETVHEVGEGEGGAALHAAVYRLSLAPGATVEVRPSADARAAYQGAVLMPITDKKLQTFGLMLPTDLNNYTDRPQTLLCVRPDQPRPDEVMAASSVATARAEESSATSTSTQQTQPTAPTAAAAVPEDVAAAVAAQAAAVRRLKESGLGNKDPAVAAAVLELKRLKGLAEA